MFVWLSNSVAIKKGNKDGTTEFAHKLRPCFAADKLSLEKVIKNRVKRQKQTGMMLLFIDKIKNFTFGTCTKYHLL